MFVLVTAVMLSAAVTEPPGLIHLGHPVQVARLTPDDLAEARAVVWTSSLSGVVAVTAVDGRTLPPPPPVVAALNERLGL